MKRHFENRGWLLVLVALAIALTAACSSSNSTPDAGETPDALTGG